MVDIAFLENSPWSVTSKVAAHFLIDPMMKWPENRCIVTVLMAFTPTVMWATIDYQCTCYLYSIWWMHFAPIWSLLSSCMCCRNGSSGTSAHWSISNAKWAVSLLDLWHNKHNSSLIWRNQSCWRVFFFFFQFHPICVSFMLIKMRRTIVSTNTLRDEFICKKKICFDHKTAICRFMHQNESTSSFMCRKLSVILFPS